MRCTIPLVAVLGLVAGVAACSSDGTTPNCPEVKPLYDVREAGASKTLPPQQQALVDKHCATPLGTATSGAGGAPPVDAATQ